DKTHRGLVVSGLARRRQRAPRLVRQLGVLPVRSWIGGWADRVEALEVGRTGIRFVCRLVRAMPDIRTMAARAGLAQARAALGFAAACMEFLLFGWRAEAHSTL